MGHEGSEGSDPGERIERIERTSYDGRGPRGARPTGPRTSHRAATARRGHPSTRLVVAVASLLLLGGCGTGRGPAEDGRSRDRGVDFDVEATQRRAEAPGGQDIDGVQVVVITSQEELDSEWPRWEPLGTEDVSVAGLGTMQSLVMLWAAGRPVRVTAVRIKEGRPVVEGLREVPGEGCVTTQEVTGWTTIVVVGTVPSRPDSPELAIEERPVDC